MTTFWILSITLNFYTQVITVSIYPPAQFVSVPEGSAAFTCLLTSDGVDTIIGVQWIVNGTIIESLDLINVVVELSPIGRGVGSLQFTDLPVEYNNTRIQCRADLQSGRTEMSSETVLLLVQGLLPAVQSLEATVVDPTTIFLSWTPPLSRNIDGIDNNLRSYCVEVINKTSLEPLLLQCNIGDEEFSYPVPANVMCSALRFLVTPVNAFGHGESRSVQYSPETSPEVMEVVRADSAGGIIYSLIMSAPVCSAELIFEDKDNNDAENIKLRSTDLVIVGNNITFTASQLKTNRHYDVSYEASNITGLSTSISTHDLKNYSATDMMDTVQFQIDFFDACDAIGAMFGFVFMESNEDVNFTKSVWKLLNKSAFLSLDFLKPGQYMVHGYDIEHNGMLKSGDGYPAVARGLTISGSPSAEQLCHTNIEDCQIITFSANITVKCTSLNSSVTGFQVVAQLRKAGEVCVLHTSQNVDLRTAAAVVVENDGTYRVTVLAIRSEVGIMLDSCPYTAMTSVLIREDTPGPATQRYVRDNSIILAVVVPLLLLLLLLLIFIAAGVVALVKYKIKPRKSDCDKPVIMLSLQNGVYNMSTSRNSESVHSKKVPDVSADCTNFSTSDLTAPTPQIDISDTAQANSYDVVPHASSVHSNKPDIETVLELIRNTPPKTSLQRNMEFKTERIHSLSRFDGVQDFVCMPSSTCDSCVEEAAETVEP